MMSVLLSLLTLRTWAHSRAALQLEVLALRHQLQVLQRSRPRRLRLARADRWLWAWLLRAWGDWRTAVVIADATGDRPSPRCSRPDSDDVGAKSAVGSATYSR